MKVFVSYIYSASVILRNFISFRFLFQQYDSDDAEGAEGVGDEPAAKKHKPSTNSSGGGAAPSVKSSGASGGGGGGGGANRAARRAGAAK